MLNDEVIALYAQYKVTYHIIKKNYIQDILIANQVLMWFPGHHVMYNKTKVIHTMSNIYDTIHSNLHNLLCIFFH